MILPSTAQTQGETSLPGKETMPLLQQEAKLVSSLYLGQVREDSLQRLDEGKLLRSQSFLITSRP